MRFNLANQITLSRLLVAIIFFAVLSMFDAGAEVPRMGLLLIGLGLYILAGVTDVIDGEIARRHSGVTMFGRVIDPFVDKVLVLGAYIFLASSHFALGGGNVTGVEGWMVIIILIRELLVTDLRMVSEAQGTQFAATFYGKLKMAVQSVAIGWILLSLWLGGVAISGPWYVSRQIAAGLAVAVTVVSLVVYLRRAEFLLSER